MKILMLAPQPFFTQRGTPIAIRAAAEALSSNGHEIDILTYFNGQDVDIPNVEIVRIARPPIVRSVPIGPSWQKIPCNLYMLRKAQAMLSAGEYDLIHGVEEGGIMAWLLTRWHPRPYIFDMDSHMSAQIKEKSRFLTPFAWIFSLFETAALRQSSGVIAVCPALEEVARRSQSPDRIIVLPDMPLNQGVESEPSQEIVSMGGIRVIYVGNLQEYQGVDLLIESFRNVTHEYAEARLVIVGGSRGDIDRLAKPVIDLVEEGKIRFLGPRPLQELGEVLAAGDILVSPRLKGINTPMKIYSYLEAGRPVLATRLRTHTQVLNDDVAYLVEPTVPDMADGLSQLLGDRSLRHRIGARGREFVRGKYGRDRFVQRLSTFYTQLLEQ